MAINGSIEEAGLPDVLQLLTLGRKTGCLSVDDGKQHGEVFLEVGRISYASVANRDRIGEMLVKSGRITREQLSEAAAEQGRGSNRPIGRILVDSGRVDRAELERFLRQQVEEAVYLLFTWKQGHFTFTSDRRPAHGALLVSLDAESLLLEGARRVDEWSQIEKKIPSFDLIYQRTKSARRSGGSSDELTDDQRRIVPLLDGTRDVAGIVDVTGLNEFDVGKALYGLIIAGFAQLVERRANVRHLDYRELLAYVVREAEFADAQRRKQAARHIVDCPSCTDRLRTINVRRTEGTPPGVMVDPAPVMPPVVAPPAVTRPAAPAFAAHGAQAAAASGERRAERERRTGRDRRQFERRAGLDRRANAAAQPAVSRERRHDERRHTERRARDVDRRRGARTASAPTPEPARTGRSTVARQLKALDPPAETRPPAEAPVQVAPPAPGVAAAAVAPPPVIPDVEAAPSPAPEREIPPQPEAPASPADKGLVWLMSPEESIKLIRESQFQLRAALPPATPRPQPPAPPPAPPTASPPAPPPVTVPPRTVAASATPGTNGGNVSIRVTSPVMRTGGAEAHADRTSEPPRSAPVVTHAPGTNGRRQVTILLPSTRQMVAAAVIVGVALLGYAAGQSGRGASAATGTTETGSAPEPAAAATPAARPQAREAARPAQTAAPAPRTAPTPAPPVERPAATRAPAPVTAPPARAVSVPTPPPATTQRSPVPAPQPAAAVPIAAAPVATAPPPAPTPTTGSVRGTVRDANGRGIAGARVSVRGSTLAATTDGSGAFEIRDVPEGAVVVQAAAEGFVSATADVRARAGAAVSADLALAAPAAAAEPDRELAAGGWAGVDRAEAATLMGGGFGAIQGLTIESIARSTAGSRPRVRVTQLTAAGERIVLTETRAGAAVRSGPATITALRVMPPSEAYPLATGTVSFGGILITAKASISAEALRAHLERLGEIQ